MSKKVIAIIVAVAIIIVFLLALHVTLNTGERRSFGGRDQEKFNQSFSQMVLAKEGEQNFSSASEQFSTTDEIAVLMNVTNSTEVWISVDNRNTGKYTGVETRESVQEGINSVVIGKFSEGDYVARVVVDDVLVKNLPFIVD
jgi:hypothetical protein